MKTGKLNWMVVNLTKGLFDGNYAEQRLAEEAADGWMSVFPDDAILVVRVAKANSRIIPDARWMASYLRGQ